MPRTKSGQVRGKIFRGPGQIPLFSIFLDPVRSKSEASFSGPGQAFQWFPASMGLVWGKFFSMYQA